MNTSNDISLNPASINDYFRNNSTLLGEITLDISINSKDISLNKYPFYLYSTKKYDDVIEKKYEITTRPNETLIPTTFYVPIYSKLYDLSKNHYTELNPFKDFTVPPMTDISYNKLDKLKKVQYKLDILKDKINSKKLVDKYLDAKTSESYKLQFTVENYNNYKYNKIINKQNYLNHNGLGLINKLLFNNPNATFLLKSKNSDEWIPHYIKSDTIDCKNIKLQCLPTGNVLTNREIFKLSKDIRMREINKKKKEEISKLETDDKKTFEKNFKLKSDVLTQYYSIVEKMLFGDITSSLFDGFDSKDSLSKECVKKLFRLTDKTDKSNNDFFINMSKFETIKNLTDISFNEAKNKLIDSKFVTLKCKDTSNIDVDFVKLIDKIVDNNSKNLIQKYTDRNRFPGISIQEKETNNNFITAFQYKTISYNVYLILKNAFLQSYSYRNKPNYTKYKYIITVEEKDLIPYEPKISILTKKGRTRLAYHFNKFKKKCSVKDKNGYTKVEQELFKKCEKLCQPLPGTKKCENDMWCKICKNYISCVYGYNEIKDTCTKDSDASGGLIDSISKSASGLGSKLFKSMTKATESTKSISKSKSKEKPKEKYITSIDDIDSGMFITT